MASFHPQKRADVFKQTAGGAIIRSWAVPDFNPRNFLLRGGALGRVARFFWLYPALELNIFNGRIYAK